jgi:hypothetical protein
MSNKTYRTEREQIVCCRGDVSDAKTLRSPQNRGVRSWIRDFTFRLAARVTRHWYTIFCHFDSENLFHFTCLLFATTIHLFSCSLRPICCLYLLSLSLFSTIFPSSSHNNYIHHGKLSVDQRSLAEDGEDVG